MVTPSPRTVSNLLPMKISSKDSDSQCSLVDMHVIDRTGGNIGRGVEPYEDKGLKDVVWLGPGETVFVEAAYQPWDGLYM